MEKDRRKEYCSIDHANKQKELARFTPYEFWTNQVKRRDFRHTEKEKAQRQAAGNGAPQPAVSAPPTPNPADIPTREGTGAAGTRIVCR